MQQAVTSPARDLARAHDSPLTRALRVTLPFAWVQIAVLLGLLVIVALTRAVDPDFWWHTRTGQLIFASGIPRHDPFSWSAAGKPWVAHEWLSEALIYAVQASIGYTANVVLFSGVTLSAVLLMYALARRAGAGTRVLVALLFVTVVVLSFYVTVRPQEFTWLLFAAFVYLLQRDYEGEHVPAWLLPVLTALWANLHLGFVYGLMAVGLWVAAAALDRVRGRDVDLRRPALIAGACVAASCLNPDGPVLLWYPARYVFHHEVTAYIGEWYRPDPRVPVHAPIFLTNLLLALVLISRNRPRPFLWLVTAAAVVVSLQAVRNAPFAVLLLMPVAGAAASARWRWATSGRDSHKRIRLATAATLLAVLGAVILPLSARRTGALSLVDPSDAGYPAAEAQYVKAHLSGKRLLNEYGEGGYLIYSLYPDVNVFIDGRSDFYGSRLLRDYATIYRAQAGWDALLDSYSVEAVLIPKDSELAKKLRQSPGWREDFTGPQDSVFARR